MACFRALNSSTSHTTVNRSADLEVAKSAPLTAIAGDPANLTYSITVTNHGPSDNAGFTLRIRETDDPAAPKDLGAAEIAGRPFLLGSLRDRQFVFDNEMDAHEVEIKPFAISRTARPSSNRKAPTAPRIATSWKAPIREGATSPSATAPSR